jgi:hypothetical protein
MPKLPQFPMLSVPTSDGMPNVMMMDASSVSGGMAFLVGELEKRDEKLHEPLTSITWPRDMPVKTGGGWVDSVSVFDVSYASEGGNNDGLIGGETNDLPMIQADIGKDTYKVFQWGHILKVPLIDQQKLQKIGRNLDDVLNRGLHLAHDKFIDRCVYQGVAGRSYGLVNDASITTVTADPHTAGGSDTTWDDKTPDEILADINRVLEETWAAAEYDLSGMANHILIPPEQYTKIVSTKVGVTGDKSILTYVLENNLAHNQGNDLVIAPSAWCKGAGTGGADRMVAYCNNEDRVRFDITVPLQRMLTQASAEHMAYLTPYVTQFSELQWPYRQHAMYMDGI